MSYHDPKRRILIEGFVERVRDYVSLPWTSPYDVAEVVTRLGGSLVEDESLDHPLVQKVGERSFVIRLPKTRLETFRRYEIARMVGHLILNAGFIVDPEKWQTSNWRQDEPDLFVFADALLMPEYAYRRAFAESTDLVTLAKHFSVTTLRVLHRGHWLNLIPWGV